MKKNLCSAFLILLAVSCAPAVTPPPATLAVEPAAGGDCVGTAHEIPAQEIPIPVALVVNLPGAGDPALLWRDGTPLRSWPTGTPVQSRLVHVVGSAAGPVESLALVYLSADDLGRLQLSLNQGGQVSRLVDFPSRVFVTGLVGVPGRSVIAYSTLEASPDGSRLVSRVFLGEYLAIAAAEPVLTVESSQSRYVLPLAIHRDGNGAADGLWYTYNPWGIGGDSLSDPHEGLYYLDLASGASLEFLGPGCGFSNLSIGQNWAAWASAGAMNATDLHSGASISFPVLEGNDRVPARAFLSPSEGFLAWLEGRGFEYDGNLETTLRVGSLEGGLIADYSLAAFVEPAGLGAEIAIIPLGWLMPDNETLLVAVSSVVAERVVLVYVDVHAGTISLLREALFLGFSYP
ncbi:MAG: hypothetical protein JXB85_15770 [Anaerolineales bacterium]|nr:hypothetical protein [Anaerolineales bacterium]